MNLTLLLQLAAFGHIALLIAGISMPFVVKMREHTRALPEFLRQLFYVYYAFIGFCILGFGALTYFFADAIAKGEPLARTLAGFLAVFWLARLLVAAFVFDMKPYLSKGSYKAGYHLLNFFFLYLIGVYLWAALQPGR